MNSPKPILMTQEGLDNLQKEKEELEKNRPDAVADLKKAREMGDLSENGYYKSARAKLSSIDHRLRYLNHVIRFAKVHQASTSGLVELGAIVRLKTEQGEITYTIVGEHEANPTEKKISHLSPLGKALLGKQIGDIVIIQTPSGQKVQKIITITS